MSRVNVALQSRPQDWDYLSEGGSTIVFSYAGPSHPKFTGKVLRLRKALVGASSHDGTIGEEDDPVVAFQYTVIAALVPSAYLPDLEVVLLDAEWLAALGVLRDGDRPAKRRATDQIDKTRKKGILATDLIGGADVLAIEIKPKWGFMPNPAHLSEETAEIKTTTCRYCMHTRFRFRESDEIPTQYCPLDIYSGDETRMRKAIRDLWNGWVQSDGTLNNMRIFVSGKMIRPSEPYSSLVDFLSTTTEVHEALATALLPLLRAPALTSISNLQRSLDSLDIEGIVKLHAMVSPGVGTIKRDPSLEQLQDFVATYPSVYCALDHSKPRPENIDAYIMAYLLSATFKDCSVIFRIHQSEMSGGPSVDSPHAISIIDLDFKGASRFEQWARLDKQIAEHYQELETTERKLCTE